MSLGTEALTPVVAHPADQGAPAGEPMSAEVREVCDRLGIHDLVAIALRLIEKHFQPEQLHYEPLHDPDEDNEWLGIRAIVRGSVEEVLTKDAACSREWRELVPMDRLGLVRIVFGIR
ncbi:MAG: hypothetical protein L0Y71_03685 [Gemmataceae bacterium]|nr:hypothetical protein [Gemmataceae bacterium]